MSDWVTVTKADALIASHRIGPEAMALAALMVMPPGYRMVGVRHFLGSAQIDIDIDIGGESLGLVINGHGGYEWIGRETLEMKQVAEAIVARLKETAEVCCE